jgi:hypothetical protein
MRLLVPAKQKWFLSVLVALVVPLTLAVTAAPALASGSPKPWWHLTSGTRPAVLVPGSARDEVQELTVSATGGSFVLFHEENGVPVGLAFVKFDEATHEGPSREEVQMALTEGEGEYDAGRVIVLGTMYGKGNAQVVGGPADEAGTKPYVITFSGELADRSVESLAVNGESLTGGRHEATLAEKTIGHPDGEIVLMARNLGDAPVDAGEAPVVIKDLLPSGLTAVSIEGKAEEQTSVVRGPVACVLSSLTCTFKENLSHEAGTIPPYFPIEVVIGVNVTGSVSKPNEASVSGGKSPEGVEVPPVPVARGVRVGGSPAPFGIEDYELTPEEEGGAPDTQAGSHPFQLTTTLALNQTLAHSSGVGGLTPHPVAQDKDLRFNLPAGLIGNPTPFPRCTLTQFLNSNGPACSQKTVVGIATVALNFIHEPNSIYNVAAPVFNLEPNAGEPARFAFSAVVPVYLDISVRTGSDYGVTVSVDNTNQEVDYLSSQVTFWGVPGDPRHDVSRGLRCLEVARGEIPASSCVPSEGEHPPPLLSLPTSCTGPLHTSVEADSWIDPGVFGSLEGEPMPAMDGCDRLPFSPEIKVTPDGTAASTPTGLNVDVHVPQDSVTCGSCLAESNVKGIEVALPEGVAVNPAGGDGLQACGEGLVGFLPGESAPPESLHFTATPKFPEAIEPGINMCPNASKIGEVTIHSPLLPPTQPIKGFVYLASQNENPFGSLIALYLVAQDPVSGFLFKAVGETRLTSSGQIVTTFRDNPQLAFEDAELHFFGGERGPLASPARCGPYMTSASFMPWSAEPGEAPHTATSTFNVTSGSNGGPCTYPGQALPFSPSLTGGSMNINAGSFTPLTTTIGRGDGQQDMQSVTLHFPPGLSGLLSNVKLCPEAQANAGTCGPESLIGETTVSAGVGSDPVSVKGGRVYITEKYHGAPFGLSIVNPVKAGPFDLEHDTSNPVQNPACDCVVVRAKIEVDPHTAALTVTTNKPGEGYEIPHLIDGIPVQIQKVNVTITGTAGGQNNFTFNPTNCNPMKIEGSISGYEGASSPVSMSFQAANCAVLKFTPKFSASTSGKTSKAKGASLHVKLSYPNVPFGSEANIASVKVDLPKQLPSRLTTLQKACTAAQFAANPAGCPAASIVGHAIVHTPLLPVVLEGPAYFVSNGGEAFPNLIMVLQGYGVTVDLVGDTFISKAGVTSSTFRSTPDVPFSTFELDLPEGKFSALAANTNLCATTKSVKAHKRVTIHRRGRTVHVLRSVTKLVPTLSMPTTIIAQNGARIEQKAKINVTSCSPHKAKKRAKKAKAGKHTNGKHRTR